MEKIVVETIPITRVKEKLQFQVIIPENATKLTGIDVSTDKNLIVGGGVFKLTHRGVGIVRLYIADENDCFFSQMLHSDYMLPKWEKIGNEYITTQVWSQAEKTYSPFPMELLANATVIQGHYEDLVGYLNVNPPEYNIRLTLHFQISHP